MTRYLRNLMVMVGLSTMQRVLGMVTTMVLARALGSTHFGIYGIVINTASSAYGLVRLGADAAIHVHTAEYATDESTRIQKGQLLGVGLVLLSIAGVLAGAGCLLGARWLAETVYGQGELAAWIRLAGLLVLIQCLAQFCYALLAGLHRFQDYARWMIGMSVVGILVISSASVFSGLLGAVIGNIAVQFVSLLGLAFLARHALSIESISLSLSHLQIGLGKILRTGVPFYLAGLIIVPIMYIVQGQLVKVAGLDMMGGVRVIAALSTLITFLPHSVAAVMVSHFTRSSSDNYDHFVRTVTLNLKSLWLFSLIAGSGLAVVLPLVIGLLFGKSYMAYVPAAYVAIASAVFAVLLGAIGNIAFSRHRVMFILGFTCVQMLIFVVVAQGAIPQYGLTGYYFAELAGHWCAMVFIWLTVKNWKERHQVHTPWQPWLVGLTMVFVASCIFNSMSATGLSWAAFLGFVVFCSVITIGYYVILSQEEKAILHTNINRALTKSLVRT